MTKPHEPPLSVESRRLFTALQRQSSLAWSILKTQCELVGRNPSQLCRSDLPVVVPRVVAALSRFTTPSKAEAFARDALETSDSARPEPAKPPEAPSSYRPSTRLYRPQAALGDLGARTLQTLEQHTPLAWPILEAQCAKAGKDLAQLSPQDLIQLVPALSRALGRFTSPEKAAAVSEALLKLGRET